MGGLTSDERLHFGAKKIRFMFGKDLNDKYCGRAGIIAYIVTKKPEGDVADSTTIGLSTPDRSTTDDIHFLFAIDSKSGDLTDCGGWAKPNEMVLTCAEREFMEESIDTLPSSIYTSVNSLALCGVLTDIPDVKTTSDVDVRDTMSILFLPLHIPEIWLEIAPKIFLTRLKRASKKCEQENSGLMWLNSSEFKERIFSPNPKKPIMWDKVREFLAASYDDTIEKSLKQIYNTIILP